MKLLARAVVFVQIHYLLGVELIGQIGAPGIYGALGEKQFLPVFFKRLLYEADYFPAIGTLLFLLLVVHADGALPGSEIQFDPLLCTEYSFSLFHGNSDSYRNERRRVQVRPVAFDDIKDALAPAQKSGIFAGVIGAIKTGKQGLGGKLPGKGNGFLM